MPDAGASRKRQISGCRSRKPFDDIGTPFRVSQTNPPNRWPRHRGEGFGSPFTNVAGIRQCCRWNFYTRRLALQV
jgi:hypothetical protein